MAQLNMPIPDDVHRDAKIAATKWGVTLRAFVIAALRALNQDTFEWPPEDWDERPIDD